MSHAPVGVGHDDGQEGGECPEEQGRQEVVNLLRGGEVLEVEDRLQLRDDVGRGGEEEQHHEQHDVDQESLRKTETKRLNYPDGRDYQRKNTVG